MATPRLLKPASRLVSTRLCSASIRSAFKPAACSPSVLQRRTYATPSGTKEVTVREALNDALAEELTLNEKVFILGEEVAQYNGALVAIFTMYLYAGINKVLMNMLSEIQLQGNKRPAGPIRPEEGHRYPHHRTWFLRISGRSCVSGIAPRCE